MPTSNPIKYAAAGIAAVVLAFGAYALGNSSSDNGTAGSANAAQQVAPGGASRHMPQNGQMPHNGQAPQGFGTTATGADATKAKAAALAKYPGTVERVMKLQDGSYVVHVFTNSGGEVHVAVSKDFKVTGTEQGPPQGGAPGVSPSGTNRSGTNQ
jgi:hypothetical protein